MKRRARSTAARCRALLLALGAVFVVLSVASPAEAYPWMIRHGYAKCNACHSDPSGGETLNSFGRLQADQLMEMRYGDDTAPKSRREFLWGVKTPSWIHLGGSYRGMVLYRPEADDSFDAFPMQADLYGSLQFSDFRAGGSIGFGRVPAGSPHVRGAQVTRGNGDDDPNLISRNHWLGWQLTPELLLRGGRINLPFGLRIPEHVMWVREATRTDRESDQQHGAAVAFTTKKVRGEVMGIAGNYQLNPDSFRERGYAGQAEYLIGKYAIGASSQLTFSNADVATLVREDTTRGAHGVMARLSPVKPLVLMVEMDVLHQSRRDLGYVGLLQADVEPIQGLHFIATGEILDGGQLSGGAASPGSGEPRFGGWVSVNWFFFSHFDLRVDAVLRTQDDFSLQSQVHVYF